MEARVWKLVCGSSGGDARVWKLASGNSRLETNVPILVCGCLHCRSAVNDDCFFDDFWLLRMLCLSNACRV